MNHWKATVKFEVPVTSTTDGLLTLTPLMVNGMGKFSPTISVQYSDACDLKITSFTGTNKIINPSSGGNLAIKGDISDSSGQSVTWTLSTPDGKTTTGSGTSVSAIWDGKDASGKVVDPGSYSATLTAQTADGNCTDSKTLNITVTDVEDGQCGLYVQFGSSAHMASGNLTHSQALFSTRGSTMPAQITLNYNSLDHYNGPLGRGWSHNYDVTLKENIDGSVLIHEGNWRHKYYTISNGVYIGQPGNYSTLIKNTDGRFTLSHKDGQIYTFDSGKLASISDRNGNALNLAYSGNNLSSVTDPSGRATSLSYDSVNHLTSITDPSGSIYTFSVGTDLTSVVQSDGGTWQYTYDTNGFMLTKIDPMGNITTYAYDDKHRVTTSTDLEGRTRSISYPQTTGTVKSTSFTEKDGGVWQYSYDTQKGYLVSKTDPQGGVTSYAYDASGNRTLTTQPDGSAISSTYDTSGNMITSTDALGQTTSYTYNGFGQVTGTNDPQGGVMSYVYDTKGNTTSLTDPSGATTKYEYDAKGNVTKVTDAAGQTTGFTYDTQGNLAMATDPSGATTAYTYDVPRNVISITDTNGAVTRFVYDASNRLIKSIDPIGNATVYSYDANGNKISETDANGNVTKYEYNSHNQLVKTIDALGNVTTYAYGGSTCPSCGGGGGEKLTSLSDANNNNTSYFYDQLGHLVKETDPLGNITSYVYGVKGNLTSKTDATGNTITYSYDANSRLLRKAYPDSTEETFTYDPKGNILTSANKHISYNFSYDAVGRMQSSTDSNGKVLQYSYDTTGKKTKTIYPEGSVVSYAYDGTGRLANITDDGGRTYRYNYDTLGRRTKLSYPNGATANYGSDTIGRLTNLDHKQSNGKIIASFAYSHDKVGNRLTKAEPGTTWNYGYDTIYRLLQALPTKQREQRDERNEDERPDRKVWAEQYSFDPVGNRLTGPRINATYSYGPGNQLLTATNFSYIYDKNGNQIGKTQRQRGNNDKGEHDNDQEGKNWTYSYDYENRLIKAEKQDEDEKLVVTFKYDSFGRRIEKKVESIEHGKVDEAKTYTYVYDGQAIILEYLTKIEDGETKTDVTKYVHGPGIDELLSIQKRDEVNYYHADGLGSIVALTDKKQKLVESYEYDSYGNLKGHESRIKQPFTYTGREWDNETGLYYYRARYYDPMEGRFVSKDPIGFKGGLNQYSYVGSNPIIRFDPIGLSYLVYNANNGIMAVYTGDGQIAGTFDAANNAQKSSRGQWEAGTYDFSYWMPHSGDGPDSSFGSNGNFVFNVEGCSGCGVHAGRENLCDRADRCGVEYATNGCVRTTDFATSLIRFLQINGDALTTLQIIK